ncbi:MAG: hypothetical protein Q4D62_01030 [Planctomycetia bacterium]|nr:hypothetical protein [Planctomycetia bacterium]
MFLVRKKWEKGKTIGCGIVLSQIFLAGMIFAQEAPSETIPVVEKNIEKQETSIPEETPPVPPTFTEETSDLKSSEKTETETAPSEEASLNTLFPFQRRALGESIPLYLSRKDGKWIAIPGIGLEQVEELLHSVVTQRDKNDAKPTPEYVFHSMLADGKVEKEAVRLQVTFQVETFQDRPVRIPLRLDEGILLSDPREAAKEADLVEPPTAQKPENVVSRTAETTSSENIETVPPPLPQPPTEKGRLWVEFSEKNGFVAWVTGRGIHELELTFLVPIVSGAGDRQFCLQFPYATTSELKMSIPQTRWESEMTHFSMNGGTLLQSAHFVPGSSNADEGETQLLAMRLGGEYSLSWKVTQKPEENTPTVLEAEGLIFTIIGKDLIEYDARLKILFNEESHDTFRVRLPENAQLVPVSNAHYSVEYVSEEEAGGNPEGTGNRPLVEVRLKTRRTSGMQRVDIHAKVPLQTGEISNWFDISGFEVLSAVRQSGYYAIKTLSGQHANWTPGPGVNRYEELPFTLDSWRPVSQTPPTLIPVSRRESSYSLSWSASTTEGSETEVETEISAPPIPETPVVETLPMSPVSTVPVPGISQTVEWDAVFEYVSQPAPLWTRIITRTTRVNIEPSYVVTVKRDELCLEATWNCTIRGGKITWLDIDLGDWAFRSVGPDNLVSMDSLEVDASGRISVPLVQASGGHLTLTFQAYRKLEEGITDVAFTLPKKVSSTIPSVVITSTPSELIVLSAANVELTPESEKCYRLVRQPAPSMSPLLTAETPEMLLYRCESEEAQFAAKRHIHQRTIAVREYTQLEIYRQEYRIRKTFEYSVAYGSVNQLRFQVPEMSAEKMEIQISAPPSLSPQTGLASSPTTPAAEIPPEIPPLAAKGVPLVPGVGAGVGNGVAGETTTVPSPSLIPVPGAETVASLASKPPVVKIKPTTESSSPWMEVTMLLPEERMGIFSVTLQYAFPLEKLEVNRIQKRDFHLAWSLDGRVVENLLEIASEDSIQILPPQTIDSETPWEELGTFLARRTFAQESDSGKKRNLIPCMLCKSEKMPNKITLGMDLKEVSPQDITIIDRYWLQTWLTGTTRQDRAVFLFPPIVDVQDQSFFASVPQEKEGENTVPARAFTINLPQRAAADSAEVWIDRKPAQLGTEVKRLSANSLQVILPATPRNIPRTVEIRYQFEKKLPKEGNFQMEIPYVQDITWVRGMYWQVVLPGDTHILKTPPGFSMEYRWGWNQCFWGRVPIWEQNSLERWSGAIQGSPAPMKMNRYVFAGMGSRETLATGATFYLVNRTTLVVVLAVGVFWLGVLFLYFAFMRRPMVLLLFLILLGAFVVRSPDLALLGLQAISLGGVLLLISSLCGLFRLAQREPQYPLMRDEDTTVVQSSRTIISLLDESPVSQEAKTITYEQALEIPDQDATVARKIKTS